MIKEYQIHVLKKARYYVLGNEKQEINKLWFVFHGYGELAGEFIQNFKVLNNKNSLIIAPEGLNKFYTRGFNGKVGANWMTKENREEEIIEYVSMIDKIYKEITSAITASGFEVKVLGFSQGTHTAVRWLNESKIQIKELILWSGAFPHDFNYKDNEDYWNRIEKKIIIGNKDQFISRDKLNSEIEFIKQQNLSTNILKFSGGHEIDSEMLKQLNV